MEINEGDTKFLYDITLVLPKDIGKLCIPALFTKIIHSNIPALGSEKSTLKVSILDTIH